LTVLIVDDDELTRRLIASGLRKVGWNTREAEGAEAAINLLETDGSIALVITDVMMPETDGLSMVSELRRNPSYAELPVLICTATGTPAAVSRALGLNIAGYLLKPIDIPRLRETVAQILGAPRRALADVPKTRARLDVDPDRYRELLAELVERLEVSLTEMARLIDNGQFKDLYSLAAALGGAAQNLGAERVAATLAGHLQACENGEPARLSSLLSEMRSEVAILRQAAQEGRPKSQPRAGAGNFPAPPKPQSAEEPQ